MKATNHSFQKERPKWQQKRLKDRLKELKPLGTVGIEIWLDELYKLDMKWAKFKVVK